MSQLLLVLLGINALALYSLGAEAATHLHILPDNRNVSETCKMQNSCISFSNCSSEPEQCFQSDTTLHFQPTVYYLEEHIVVRDVHNLSLCGVNCDQSLFIATIHCRPATGFRFINVSFFHVQNIKLVSCGFPISLTELQTNATFQDGQAFLQNTFTAGLQILLSFQVTLDNVNITNSKGNGIFWVNPLGTSHIRNSMVTHTNYNLISKQLYKSLNCTNETAGCQGGNVWILFVDMDCSHKDHSKLASFFSIQHTEISFGVNLNNYIWGPRYAAGLGISFTQTSFDVQFRIENSNIHDNVGDAGANIYCRMMNFVSNSSMEVVNTSLSYGNRPFIDPQYIHYFDQAPGMYIDIDSENVVPQLEICNHHHKAIHTNISLNNVTMQENLGGGMKVFISNSGKWTVPCCFQVQISNTFINGSYIYYYTSTDRRSSLALLIQESKESKESIMNVSLSGLTISNSHVVHQDDSWKLADYPKLSTIVVSDASSVYIHNCSIEANHATGIVALSSTMHMIGNNTLKNNSGIIGGAMSLDAYSTMYLHPYSILRITNNYASSYGGGIVINQGLVRNYETPCSYQLLPTEDILSSEAHIIMKDNRAGIAGDGIYGGDLLKCSQNSQKLVHESQREKPENIFNNTFIIELSFSTDSELSSAAVGLCYCTHSYRNCNISSLNVSVYPGQHYTVQAVGIGYYGGTTPSVILQTLEGSNQTGVTLKKDPQSLGTVCDDLRFEVEAPENVSDISIRLTAEGSAFPFHFSKILSLAIKPCPVGFHLTENRCTCSPALSKLSVHCNISNQSFYRTGSLWISFTNHSVLYYEHCPSEYCKTAGIHLNASNPDTQCDLNHSGILCGSCKEGFSIALGSSRCAPCTDQFLGLIPAFVLAGIVLVVFLTVLNLTVATGTINDLIFYANIIQAVREAFGLTANGSKIMSVFIAWLNLDLGLEVCFSSNLDIYTKTFLQFLFPVYIWILVFVIIVSSHYSTTIARLAGNNAVPVLATLFLLSYAKIQRVIITTLSFIFIHQEDVGSFAVWKFDGNLRFLSEKHIPLFVTSILFMTLFLLPLTLLLLFESHLQKLNHFRIVRIMSKLKPLLDAFQGPYKVNYRFWPGLMLVVRSVLLVAFALNVSGDPGINLLVITLLTSAVAAATLFQSGGVYKNLPLNLINSFYLYNLIGFAAWTLFNRYQYTLEQERFSENQSVASHIMLGTAALIFILTILYHVYQKLKKSEVISTCFKQSQRKKQQEFDGNEDEIMPLPIRVPPTYSYVSIRESLLDETV